MNTITLPTTSPRHFGKLQIHFYVNKNSTIIKQTTSELVFVSMELVKFKTCKVVFVISSILVTKSAELKDIKWNTSLWLISVLLRYSASWLSDWCPTFRDSVLVSYSRVECPMKDYSALDDRTTTLSLNVRHQRQNAISQKTGDLNCNEKEV